MQALALNPKTGEFHTLQFRLRIEEDEDKKTLLWGPKEGPLEIKLHYDTPPNLIETETPNQYEVENFHVYVKNKNFLLASEDEQNRTDIKFLAIHSLLPHNLTTLPLIAYNHKGPLPDTRAFCAKSTPHATGRLAFWCFSILHPGETIEVAHQPPFRREPHYFKIHNWKGELQSKFLQG